MEGVFYIKKEDKKTENYEGNAFANQKYCKKCLHFTLSWASIGSGSQGFNGISLEENYCRQIE